MGWLFGVSLEKSSFVIIFFLNFRAEPFLNTWIATFLTIFSLSLLLGYIYLFECSFLSTRVDSTNAFERFGAEFLK